MVPAKQEQRYLLNGLLDTTSFSSTAASSARAEASKNKRQEDFTKEDSNGYSSGDQRSELLAPSSKKQRKMKKRVWSSCSACRKLKTKCEFIPKLGKCERCRRLLIDCSLKELVDEEDIARETNSDSVTGIESWMQSVENTFKKFEDKLDSVVQTIRQTQSEENGQSNDVDEKSGSILGNTSYSNSQISSAPLNVIKRIDSQLFNRADRSDPLKKACDEFIQFYFSNEEICIQLAKSFLEISHFWIIPGGIKEIDRRYVLEHPFITCVFVILAMCFDENYMYVKEQEQLYWLTMKLLGVVVVTDPLTDHDIEALLYLSLYNIARKPKQTQTDNWLISGIGIKHLMLSLDIRGISTKVNTLHRFEALDLYHLRIFNSLCSCHLQNSLGTGQPVMITKEYFDVHSLALKFPNATFGDAIKVSEIELYLMTVRLITSPSSKNRSTTAFDELQEWEENWRHLIKRDVAGLLTFAYHFCYILLLKNLTKTTQDRSSKSASAPIITTDIGHTALVHHAFKILELFLNLKPKLVRGSPSFSLAQIVYACVTLCDSLSTMDADQKNTALSLISKVYWHLNQIGEKMNDATDTVGKIVMSLVERANPKEITSANDEPYVREASATSRTTANVEDTTTTPASIDFNFYSRELNDSKLSPLQIPDRTSLPDSINHGISSGLTPNTPFQIIGNEVPDLSQFESFEAFFTGVFPEYKGESDSEIA
ncbi:unnamed protein product [Kuraishia capsulata CBS 1993]|uniref:Zn(2)-C6 fungal-type domain-containing protein n=1 Tax=Kuraishia capsulata CBS 1993 TaxID=1382522 RepID=W6MKU1_9ASCO|nr:uncharacterized protein KUCA_T00002983001 [Kuraishia capsulata CBS 1993]CDK27006.1 unnamed protein product [Kuraishia capsulata CBS 1993]